MEILLDTCALIWWTLDPDELPKKTIQKIEASDLLVSTISIWEIGIKIKNKKLELGMNIEDYLAKLKQLGQLTLAPVDEVVWVKNLSLDWAHRDPADHTIVATALLHDCPIATRDSHIIDFYPKIL